MLNHKLDEVNQLKQYKKPLKKETSNNIKKLYAEPQRRYMTSKNESH